MRTLSEQDIQSIINMYESGFNAAKICAFFKTGKKRILDILRSCNVTIRQDGSKRKYFFNEQYLATIDTPEKAQILGLLYADGCLIEKTNTIQLQLSEPDQEYLEKIKTQFRTDKPLIYKKPRLFFSPQNKKEYMRKAAYTLVLQSSVLYKDCLRHRLTPRKSFLPTELPDIKPSLWNSFILGFFEGDGCIYVNKRSRVYRFNILCQETIAIQLRKIFEQKLKINMKLKQTKSTSTGIKLFYLENQRRGDILKIFDWLYKDTSFYMERKYRKFKSIAKNDHENIS